MTSAIKKEGLGQNSKKKFEQIGIKMCKIGEKARKNGKRSLWMVPGLMVLKLWSTPEFCLILCKRPSIKEVGNLEGEGSKWPWKLLTDRSGKTFRHWGWGCQKIGKKELTSFMDAHAQSFIKELLSLHNQKKVNRKILPYNLRQVSDVVCDNMLQLHFVMQKSLGK